MEASGTTGFSRNRIEHEFMQWIMKWYYTSAQNEGQRVKPNAMFLIYLLKSVGFELEKFEKSPSDSELNIEEGVVKITIECGTSKTKALLSMDNVQWPSPDVINNTDDFFWSVSGTEPTGTSNYLNKFEIGSNLLPQMAPETFQLLKDVCQGLMEAINTVNESTGASKGLRSLEHQPGEIKPLTRTLTHTDLQYSLPSRHSSMTNAEIKRMGRKYLNEKHSSSSQELPEIIVDYHAVKQGHGPLVRQRTYDADPSTPVSSRSVTDLSMSDNGSLISFQKPNNAVNCLQMAKSYIDQVLKILPHDGDVSPSSESFDSVMSNSTFRKPLVPEKSTTPKRTSSTSSGSLLLASLAKPLPRKTAVPAAKTGPTASLKKSPKIQRSTRRQTIGGSAFKTSVTKPTTTSAQPTLSRSSSSLSFKAGARIGVPVKKSTTPAQVSTVAPHPKASTTSETTSPMNSAMSRLFAPTKSSMLKRSNTGSNLTSKSGWKI